MSREFDNKGRFGLWRNKDRKEQTHPHLSGQGESLDGTKCWVSAWFSKDLSDDDKKTLAEMVQRYDGTSQKPFVNVVIKFKESGAAAAHEAIDSGQPASAMVDDGFDDDIPF